jgi:hypothetical protein
VRAAWAPQAAAPQKFARQLPTGVGASAPAGPAFAREQDSPLRLLHPWDGYMGNRFPQAGFVVLRECQDIQYDTNKGQKICRHSSQSLRDILILPDRPIRGIILVLFLKLEHGSALQKR